MPAVDRDFTRKCAASLWMFVKTGLRASVILCLLAGLYLTIGGTALRRFDNRSALLLKPFQTIDSGISGALETVNELPITVSNFSFALAGNAADSLDFTIVQVNNAFPRALLLVVGGVAGAWQTTNERFVRFYNMQVGVSQPIEAVEPLDEIALLRKLLSRKINYADFRLARDFFENVPRPNATAFDIPTRVFSSENIAREVLGVLFGVTETVGTVVLVCGVALLAVAGAQMLNAASKPWLAHGADKHGCCWRCALTSFKFFKTLAKPHVHLTLLLGVALLFLAVSMRRAANNMRDGVLEPLRNADANVQQDLARINEFLVDVPNSVIADVNKALEAVANLQELRERLLQLLQGAFDDVGDVIEDLLNSFLQKARLCASPCVNIPPPSFGDNEFELSASWTPTIPPLNFRAIPPRLVSLERMVVPLVDSVHTLLFNIARKFLLLGVIACAVPLYILVGESVDFALCVPQSVREYFDVSDLDSNKSNEPNSEK